MPFQSLSKHTQPPKKTDDKTSASGSKSETPTPFGSAENILLMQGLVGNQAVQRMLTPDAPPDGPPDAPTDSKRVQRQVGGLIQRALTADADRAFKTATTFN